LASSVRKKKKWLFDDTKKKKTSLSSTPSIKKKKKTLSSSRLHPHRLSKREKGVSCVRRRRQEGKESPAVSGFQKIF